MCNPLGGSGGMFGSRANIQLTDVLLSGYLPLGYFTRIQKGLDPALRRCYGSPGFIRPSPLLSSPRLPHCTASSNHSVCLSNNMGVYSKLEPVLSFPLGTNVEALEVAKFIRRSLRARRLDFTKAVPSNQLNFVAYRRSLCKCFVRTNAIIK